MKALIRYAVYGLNKAVHGALHGVRRETYTGPIDNMRESISELIYKDDSYFNCVREALRLQREHDDGLG